MRFSVLSTVLLCLGLSASVVRADSVPVAEPVTESPATNEDVKPVLSKVDYAEPVKAEPVKAEPVRSSSNRATEPVRESGSTTGEWNRAPSTPEKTSRQTHTGYYVNRVKFVIPAGVKITVKKDWYAKDITLDYPANPYTNWQGVTPDAFSFKHVGTTLEVHHATPKYLPKSVIVRVPAAVEVGA